MTAAIPRDADGDEVPWMEKWQTRTACPPPDLLLPAQEGSLPEALTTAVRNHVASCRLCTELAVALAAAADEGPSEAEAQRIGQRVRFQTRGRGRRWWTSIAAAAALAAVAGAAYMARVAVPATVPAVQQPSQPQAARLPVLALAAPAILLPPESLTLRGERRNAYAAAIEDALTPFAAGNYQDAAVRLERVARDHPRRPHAEFYLGVARLMIGSAAEAVAPLETARGLAPAGSPLHAEATWYLAIALERSGRGAAAVGPLNDMCGGSGPRKAQACEGLRHLSSR
jgi:Flp pilus assembly protein TadD